MLVDQIQKLIEPTLNSMGLELWMCEVHNQGRYSFVRITIDRPEKGVSSDDCAQASREIGAILDVEDLIKNRYELEISSPGVERLLTTEAHFLRYVGGMVKVKFRIPQNNRKQCLAIIEKVENGKVIFAVEDEKIGVMVGDIQKANLVGT